MVTVDTTLGILDGRVQDGLCVLRGIPYARPPVGELRLRAPRPARPWAGTRPATDYGPWAPQPEPATPLGAEMPGERSEDCLTLNVWTPGVDAARRPVMVWIHGGGFLSGSGASPLYVGAPLAARGDVVVVTVNYRLGILGFFAHPELADEEADGAAGNWGLLDQVAALRWVRDNIAAFGGDPANVTVFGESAGGMSVADLLTMPVARGLFHRAIVQSGPPNAVRMDRAQERAAKLLAELDVSAPHQLREVPLDRLLAAQSALADQRGVAGLPLLPVVDEAVLPVPPAVAIADGSAAPIPLLIGTNRDESKMFMVADPANRDPDEAVLLRRISRALEVNEIGLAADELIASYRDIRAARGLPVDPREVWAAIETDRVFRAASLRAARAHARHGRPTYTYLFTWASPAMGGALGACHALEIPFVFGRLDAPGMDRFAGAGPAAEALSEQMMDAWLRFARAGDPGRAGSAAWPAYDETAGATMVFGTDTHTEDAPYEQECRLWPS